MKITPLAIMVLPVALFSSVANVESFYVQNKYEQAIEEAKKSTSAYGNVQLHFLWAKSAESLGRTEEAISAYERVLMISPDYKEARIKLAKLYHKSGRMVLIKQLAEDTEDYQLSPNERIDITSLIVEDDKVNLSAKIGVGYDSNINVSPGDLDLPSSGEEIGSRFVKLQAAFNHTYQFESIKNAYLRSSAALSYQSNDDSYYNLFVGLASVGLGYVDDNYDIFVPIHYGRLHYLESDLLESIGVKPTVNIAFSSSLVGNINARYEKRSYLQETDKKRDDSVLGIGMGVYWLLNDSFSYIKANYNDYSAKYKGLIPFVEKNAIDFSTGIDHEIDDKYNASVDFGYRYTSYDDPIGQNEDKRSDDYSKIELKLSRTILKNMVGSISYSYASNSSNYFPSEYRRHISMFNLNYKY